MSIRFEYFGMTILKATALDLRDPRDRFELESSGVLTLALPNDGKICLFMPYLSALEYANALNACNDREARERKEAFDTLPDDYEAPH